MVIPRARLLLLCLCSRALSSPEVVDEVRLVQLWTFPTIRPETPLSERLRREEAPAEDDPELQDDGDLNAVVDGDLNAKDGPELQDDGDLSAAVDGDLNATVETETPNPLLRNSAALVNSTIIQEELKLRNESARDRLLLFWTVGCSYRVQDLVVHNVKNMRKFKAPFAARPLDIDLMFVHYDGNRSVWQQRYQNWYAKYATYSVDFVPGPGKSGLKIWLASDILLQNRMGHNININSYEYIWLLDEDASFDDMDLRRLVDLARESEAKIVTPAFTTTEPQKQKFRFDRDAARNDFDAKSSEGDEDQEAVIDMEDLREGEDSDDAGGGGDEEGTEHHNGVVGPPSDALLAPAATPDGLPAMLSSCQTGEAHCAFQMPKAGCKYRYVDFVEVSFALIAPSAFRAVMKGCPGCLPIRESVWGLDHVWCSVMASNSTERAKFCSILDAVPMIHRNYHTLPKYTNGNIKLLNRLTKQRVKASLRSFWAQPAREYACIPAH